MARSGPCPRRLRSSPPTTGRITSGTGSSTASSVLPPQRSLRSRRPCPQGRGLLPLPRRRPRRARPLRRPRLRLPRQPPHRPRPRASDRASRRRHPKGRPVRLRRCSPSWAARAASCRTCSRTTPRRRRPGWVACSPGTASAIIMQGDLPPIVRSAVASQFVPPAPPEPPTGHGRFTPEGGHHRHEHPLVQVRRQPDALPRRSRPVQLQLF